MTNVETVDAYLAERPEQAQRIMTELRALILETVPAVEEKISYHVPFYNYHGEFVGFAAYQKHISFGFGADLLSDKARATLTADGYKLGKGTMQIRYDQHVPREAVRAILLQKAATNEANR